MTLNKDKKELPVRVNRLVMCEVVRSDPDKECYLVSFFDHLSTRRELYFLLPKNHAIAENYRQGDLILVTTMDKKLGRFQVVSQKIPSHIINVLNLFVPEAERERYGIVFNRASSLRRSKFCKVGVFGRASYLSFKELNLIIKPYIPQLVKHMPYPVLIPAQANDLKEIFSDSSNFLLNALYPAPLDKIRGYNIDLYEKRVTIYVDEMYFPYFLHRDYVNAKLASKLTKFAYRFVASDTGHVIEVDVYRSFRDADFI